MEKTEGEKKKASGAGGVWGTGDIFIHYSGNMEPGFIWEYMDASGYVIGSCIS